MKIKRMIILSAICIFAMCLSGCAKREADSHDILEKNTALSVESGEDANEDILAAKHVQDSFGEEDSIMYIDADVSIQDTLYKGTVSKLFPDESQLVEATGVEGMYSVYEDVLMYTGNESDEEFNLISYSEENYDAEVEAYKIYASEIFEKLNYSLEIEQILFAETNGIKRVQIKYVQKLDDLSVISGMGTYDYDNIQIENGKVSDMYLMARYEFVDKEDVKVLPLTKVLEYAKALYTDGKLTIYPNSTISRIEMMYIVDRNEMAIPVYTFLVDFEGGYIPVMCFDVETGKLVYNVSIGMVNE